MDTRRLVAPGANSKPSRAHFRLLGRKDDLVERVVHAIESQIFARRLTVGARLPPEREFSQRLGVSRTVVREAVRILVTKGLLDTRHGIGTSVRAVTRHEVLEPLTLFLRSCDEKVTIDHLHQVRSILEVESAGVAAEHATEADIEELRRICAEMEAAAVNPEQFAERDSEFHRRLGETTHNPLMTLLLDSIRDLMAEVRTLVAREPGLFERVMPTHVRIVECVASRDVAGARRAMREHLAIALGIQRELIQSRTP